MDRMAAAWTGISDAWSYWSTLVSGIPGFFKPNLPAFWGAHIPLGVDRAGFYSTASLRETLAELVDCSIINRRSPRLTVGAANVRTSMMHYFDSRQSEITTEQIMASGALPPAFPAVRIDGEFYWDGGILSNTPTEVNGTLSSSQFTCGIRKAPCHNRFGRFSTVRRTFSTRAALQATSPVSNRPIDYATSSANWSGTFQMMYARARRCVNSPAMGA